MSRNKEHQALSLPGILPVFIVLLVCSLLILASDRLTRHRIEKNSLVTIVNTIEALMPAAHDNDMYEDRVHVPGLSATAYRARRGAENIGLVLMPITANGYNGDISLAMGISIDGTLFSVRVLEHNETAGLGDGIDQDISPWIHQFAGRSLDNTPAPAWAVKPDSGEFDGISGATISPRKVIRAVHSALQYHALHKQELYEGNP